MIPISLGRVLVEPFDWLSVSQEGTGYQSVCPSVRSSVSQSTDRGTDSRTDNPIKLSRLALLTIVTGYLPTYLPTSSLSLCLYLPVCASLCPSVPLSFRYLQQYCLSTRAKLPALSWSLRLSLWMILESSALLLVHISVLTDTLALYIRTIYSYLQYLYALLGNSRLGCEPNTLRLSLARKYFLCPLTVPCSQCRVLAAAF